MARSKVRPMTKNNIDARVSLPARAGCTFMIKSRTCKPLRFTDWETVDDDVVENRHLAGRLASEECTIFILPMKLPNEGSSMEQLREVLESEAVCLDGVRVWRLRTDAATILTKLVQLGFQIVSCCVDEGIYTWTLTGVDKDADESAPSGHKRLEVMTCKVDDEATAEEQELTNGLSHAAKRNGKGSKKENRKQLSLSDDEFAGITDKRSKQSFSEDEFDNSQTDDADFDFAEEPVAIDVDFDDDPMSSLSKCEDADENYNLAPVAASSKPKRTRRKRVFNETKIDQPIAEKQTNTMSMKKKPGHVYFGNYPFDQGVPVSKIAKLEKEILISRPNLLCPGPPRFNLFVRRVMYEAISNREEAAKYTASSYTTMPVRRGRKACANSDEDSAEQTDNEDSAIQPLISTPPSLIAAVSNVVVEGWAHLRTAFDEAKTAPNAEEILVEVDDSPPKIGDIKVWLVRHFADLRRGVRMAEKKKRQLKRVEPDDDDDDDDFVSRNSSDNEDEKEDTTNWAEIRSRVDELGPPTVQRCRALYAEILGGKVPAEGDDAEDFLPPRPSRVPFDERTQCFVLGEPPFQCMISRKEIQELKQKYLVRKDRFLFTTFIGQLLQLKFPIEKIAAFSTVKTYMTSAKEFLQFKRAGCRTPNGRSRLTLKPVPHTFTDAIEDIVSSVWYGTRFVVYPKKQADEIANRRWLKDFEESAREPPTREQTKNWLYVIFNRIVGRLASGTVAKSRLSRETLKKMKRSRNRKLGKRRDDKDDDDVSIASAKSEKEPEKRRKGVYEFITDDIDFGSTDVREIIGGGTGRSVAVQQAMAQLPPIPMPRCIHLLDGHLLLGEPAEQRRLPVAKLPTLRHFTLLEKWHLPQYSIFIRRVMFYTIPRAELMKLALSPRQTQADRHLAENQVKQLSVAYIEAMMELVYAAWYSLRRIAETYRADGVSMGPVWDVSDKPPTLFKVKAVISHFLREQRNWVNTPTLTGEYGKRALRQIEPKKKQKKDEFSDSSGSEGENDDGQERDESRNS